MTCDWVPGCPRVARYRVSRVARPGLILQVCGSHLVQAQTQGYHRAPEHGDDHDVRVLARELLDAEASYRESPTTQASYRLHRARRRLTEVLEA